MDVNRVHGTKTDRVTAAIQWPGTSLRVAGRARDDCNFAEYANEYLIFVGRGGVSSETGGFDVGVAVGAGQVSQVVEIAQLAAQFFQVQGGNGVDLSLQGEHLLLQVPCGPQLEGQHRDTSGRHGQQQRPAQAVWKPATRPIRPAGFASSAQRDSRFFRFFDVSFHQDGVHFTICAHFGHAASVATVHHHSTDSRVQSLDFGRQIWNPQKTGDENCFFEIQLFCGEAFTWRQLLGLGPRLRGILCTFCLEKKKLLRLGFRSVRETESKCFNFGRGPERSVRLGGRPGDLWALKSTGSTLKKPSKHFSGNAVNTTLFFVCVRQCLLRYFLLFKNLLAFRDAVKVELLNISLD